MGGVDFDADDVVWTPCIRHLLYGTLFIAGLSNKKQYVCSIAYLHRSGEQPAGESCCQVD